MADSNLDKLRALARQLTGLLDAGEVGLVSWGEAVHGKLDEIAAFSTYRPALRDARALLEKQDSPEARAWVEKVERLGLVASPSAEKRSA